METIRVRYSCNLCGIRGVTVHVPARKDEDVKEWVEQVMGNALSADHRRRSPECQPQSLQDVMIPVEGTDRIGGPAKN